MFAIYIFFSLTAFQFYVFTLQKLPRKYFYCHDFCEKARQYFAFNFTTRSSFYLSCFILFFNNSILKIKSQWHKLQFYKISSFHHCWKFTIDLHISVISTIFLFCSSVSFFHEGFSIVTRNFRLHSLNLQSVFFYN